MKLTMNHRIQPILMLVLLSSLILHPSSFARADGGAVRLRERAGGYQIAVFTSPTPFRAGPVDVSVLVQDAATGECVPEAQVTVRLKARGAGRRSWNTRPPRKRRPINSSTRPSSNCRNRAGGMWKLPSKGRTGRPLLRFGVEADEPPPRWLELWPWFAWPALVVALFGLHQVLVRRDMSTGYA